MVKESTAAADNAIVAKKAVIISVVLVAGVGVIVARGNTSGNSYSLRGTRGCLTSRHVKTSVERGKDNLGMMMNPPGGALNFKLAHNDGGFAFYRSSGDASSGLHAIELVAKSFGMTRSKAELHVTGNALVGWSNEPTKSEVRTAETCLR